jgi:hypothetical protein
MRRYPVAMRILANPVAGYIGAVLGVIALASFALFDLRGTTAKTQRHWDAEIDRIISQQQEKKRDMDMAIFAWSEIPEPESDASPQILALPSGSAEYQAVSDETDSQRVQNHSSKKYSRRGDRRRHHDFVTDLVTLPKVAATAAATTTTTLLRLR